MINRYSNDLQIVQSNDSPRYYNSVLPKSIPDETVPFYYMSRDGDRLDMLSNIFYKTPSNWWVIAKANNLVNGSLAIPAGINLFIPNI